MRIFLDANILFSVAKKSDGAVAMLVQLLLERGHECWVDDFVIIEARRNLAVKHPEALEKFESLLRTLQIAHRRGTVTSREVVDWLPPKDRPVLLAAIQLQCDALVTGDRTHFGSGYGRTFEGVKIHSPRSLAESILDSNRSK